MPFTGMRGDLFKVVVDSKDYLFYYILADVPAIYDKEYQWK